MLFIIITGLPFLRIKGESAFRFDISTLKLYLFGTVIWIRDFYLILLVLISFIFLVIFLTTVFGRLWCGWLCPQTVLLDVSGDMARLFPFWLRDNIQKALLVPLSALVSMTLIWYFIPPEEMIGVLFSNKLITGFFLVLWAVIYSELAFLGRRFCTTICPYSMLQNGLFDRDTLVIAFDRSRREQCMGCDKCVHVCPVRIDIKKGLRRECVACAECIDACRSMTLPRNLKPLISYRGRLWRGKTFMLGALNMVLLSVFLIALFTRPPFDVVLTRDVQQRSRLVNSYSYTVMSNESRPIEVKISVEGRYILIGEGVISIKPFALKKGSLLLKKIPGVTDMEPILVFSSDSFMIKQKVGYL